MHNKSCFILTSCLIIYCQDIQRNALHDLQTTNGEGKKKPPTHVKDQFIQCSYTILRVNSLGIEDSRESFPSKKSHTALSCIVIWQQRRLMFLKQKIRWTRTFAEHSAAKCRACSVFLKYRAPRMGLLRRIKILTKFDL